MVVNTEVFLGSGASLTLVPELDYYIKPASANAAKTTITLASEHTSTIDLVTNLYTGCTVDYYDNGSYASSHTITSNAATTFTITPAIASGESSGNYLDATNDYFIIRGYAMPCPAKSGTSNLKRLNADNWLGLVESATFPNVDIEMKQLNLNLGGTRNFTHQYKGIKTASGANINLACHQGAFLYYALGRCTGITMTTDGVTLVSNFAGVSASTAETVFVDYGNGGGTSDGGASITAHVETGPIMYRTAPGTNTLMPPVLRSTDVYTNLEAVSRTTSTATATVNALTYTFKEAHNSELPSFALESSIAKDMTTPALTTGVTDTTESNTFVRIARGNRVNTMTLTANENEEVKMTMDLNTAAVNKLPRTEKYEARNGISSNTALFNNASGGTEEELLNPFYFSSGKFTIFGQEFMKITNLTLTINNNIQDKRFVGIGTKDLKVGLPAQRNYELSFTALVTDDLLFEELFEENMDGSTGTTDASKIIDLQFDKDNGEQIRIKFRDYHISAANWTIPEDRGPITVEATVMPLALHEDGVSVKTHWILQG
jgi:hypothetical protein